jgi:hypothetical protein
MGGLRVIYLLIVRYRTEAGRWRKSHVELSTGDEEMRARVANIVSHGDGWRVEVRSFYRSNVAKALEALA